MVVLHQFKHDLLLALAYIAATLCFVVVLSVIPCFFALLILLASVALGYDVSFWLLYAHLLALFMLLVVATDHSPR